MLTLFHNGRFLGESSSRFHDGLLVHDGAIAQVLEKEEAQRLLQDEPLDRVVDLEEKLVLPAFVDAHCHLLQLGESLKKVDLFGCTSLSQIQDRLMKFDKENPSLARIEARNWVQDMTKPEEIDRSYFDSITEKPLYIQSFDLHSSLCNSAALLELGIDHNTTNPQGGTLVRDKTTGKLTGWLQEMAHFTFVMQKLTKFSSDEQRHEALDHAFDALLAAGYTAAGDLLMEEDTFALFATKLQRDGSLPLRVRAYWHCPPQKTVEEAKVFVDRAKALQMMYKDNAWLQVNGIKLVVDGVIDSCTAHLSMPYQDGTNAEPLWPLEHLRPIVQYADSLDLQCAIHAIGDEAVHIAVEAIASVGRDRVAKNRHRIEHLELTKEEDVKRIGQIGITTSIQPVHSDPAITPNWYKKLGGDSANEQHPPGHRCCRAFAYNEFLQSGAPIALGTDAPTAAHWPLPNLYNVATRHSALDTTIPWRTNPTFALPLLSSVQGATLGAARACHVDDVQGDFRVGKVADLNVIDLNFFREHTSDEQASSSSATPKTNGLHHWERSASDRALLRAKVVQTYKGGELVGQDGIVMKD